MYAALKYVESFEKEIDERESDKVVFSNMYDVILQECVSKDVKECDCLAQKLSNQTKYVSKEVYTELLKCFAKVKKYSISLEIDLQKRKEQAKNDTVWNEKASNGFRKKREQYIKIQDLKAKLQDKNIAISELKKLIEKCNEKSVDTKFDKSSVVRQPNAQRIPKPSVLGVNHKPNVSRPQLKSNQSRDKVLQNNNQEKIVQLILFIVDSGCTKHMTATSSQVWIWHRRLSHLNFDTINLLSKNDIVIGLPKLKFVKDHLCSSCELRKAKRKSFQTKTTSSSKRRLQLLHMDLCGPMRVESINGKKY
nr:retrovirus-related Pol polyprotein from transposon TNT 1-94 [Tanacetum cinerariifolium]